MVFFDNICAYKYIWYVILNKYWSTRSVVMDHAKSFQIISDENCWQHGHQWTADLLSSAWQLPGNKPKTFHSLHVWCQNVTNKMRRGFWTQQHQDVVRVPSLKRSFGHGGHSICWLVDAQVFTNVLRLNHVQRPRLIPCNSHFVRALLIPSLSLYRCRIFRPVEEFDCNSRDTDIYFDGAERSL